MSLLHNRTHASDEENAAWNEWNMDVALREAVEKFQSPRKSKFPRTQSAAGMMKGISFLLLHDVIRNFSCPATSSSGFLVCLIELIFLNFLILYRLISYVVGYVGCRALSF